MRLNKNIVMDIPDMFHKIWKILISLFTQGSGKDYLIF